MPTSRSTSGSFDFGAETIRRLAFLSDQMRTCCAGAADAPPPPGGDEDEEEPESIDGPPMTMAIDGFMPGGRELPPPDEGAARATAAGGACAFKIMLMRLAISSASAYFNG